MPSLLDPHHECFAQARARGMLLIDAYETAGFVRHRGHPSRLACKPEVAERIAELRRLQVHIEGTSLHALLASLRRIIMAGESSDNPTLVNAARLAIVDAARLRDELSRQQALERAQIDSVFNSLEKESGQAATPRPAAQRPSPPSEAPVSAPPTPRNRPARARPAPRQRRGRAPRAPRPLRPAAPAGPPGLTGPAQHGSDQTAASVGHGIALIRVGFDTIMVA